MQAHSAKQAIQNSSRNVLGTKIRVGLFSRVLPHLVEQYESVMVGNGSHLGRPTDIARDEGVKS